MIQASSNATEAAEGQVKHPSKHLSSAIVQQAEATKARNSSLHLLC
jgi:hypothetical protein